MTNNIKFKDLLVEITLDLSNAYEYKYIGGSDPSYDFTTSTGTDYTVTFKKSHEDDGIFERLYYPTNKEYQGKDTKENKALQVNATVMKITIDFLENNKDWNLLVIDPITESRRRMVMVLIDKNLPDKYSVEQVEGDILIYPKIN
jgi:hypothetical protein